MSVNPNPPASERELEPLDDVRFAIRVALASECDELRAADTSAGRSFPSGNVAELAEAYRALGGDLELTPATPDPGPLAAALIDEAYGFVSNCPGLPSAFGRADELKARLERIAADSFA